MTSLFHTLKSKLGEFRYREFVIGLDYRRLFLDPVLAESTLLHEGTHEFLALHSNYGQATTFISNFLQQMDHIPEDLKTNIETEMILAQLLTQESTATFMPYLIVKGKHGQAAAEKWKNELASDYAGYLAFLVEISEWPNEYRDAFTTKIPLVALNTGILNDITKENLLRQPEAFYQKLKEESYRPDWRFMKLVALVKKNPRLTTEPEEEICRQCGIQYYPSASKGEIARTFNELASLTPIKQRLTAEQISNKSPFKELINNATIADINIDLARDAEHLWGIDDLLHYKDIIEVIYIQPFTDESLRQIFIKLTSKDVKFSFLAYTQYGEKFTAALTKEEAIKIINIDLKNASFLLKRGAYSLENNIITWLPEVRLPDIIIYNEIRNTDDLIRTVKKLDHKVQFTFVAACQGHPFRTLFFKLEGLHTLHGVNTFGNEQIAKFIELIGDKAVQATLEEVVDAKSYNNYLSAWCGLPWHVNWYNFSTKGKDFENRFGS
ncbi:hypothetical protein ACFL37_00235 [Candidatus Margulisiibacteriota bacterium]